MGSKLLVLLVICLVLLITGSAVAQDLRVNVMPDGIYEPLAGIYQAYASPGLEFTIWGNAFGGTPPYTYEWDFGDGSDVVTGTITEANPRYIPANHSYATLGTKYAILTVTDAASAVDFDQVRIDVVLDTLNTRVNMAIEKGLRWLYLNNYTLNTGHWEGWSAEGPYRVGGFGMEVLAFANRGHSPYDPPDDYIYAEYMQQGLDIIMSYAVRNSNGIHFTNGTRPLYETGIALMAIVNATHPDTVNHAGPSNVIGLTFYQIAEEVVAYLSWAQNGNGGWRYNPNYYNSDNSVTQWPAIGLEAAETNWGIVPPAYVKTQLQNWINYSQNSGGGFGYSHGNDRPNVGLTGAGICEIAFCDIPYTNTRVQNAISYLNGQWYQGCSHVNGNFGNLYAMYGVAKGFRIAVDELGNSHEIKYVGDHDWQKEYDNYLIETQYPDGHWNGCNYGCSLLDTDFGVLILLPVVGTDPVAVINGPASVPPLTEFQLDGSESHHQDPSREIIEWLWDFDGSDGFDWINPDAEGQIVTCPGYDVFYPDMPDTFTVALRVKDNGAVMGGETKTDIAEWRIVVDTTNHPPVADANGPYSGKMNEEIVFDGTGSYDPDESMGDFIAGYAWDLDGDGLFNDCFDPTCSYTYTDTGVYQVVLKVWDSQADSGEATAMARVIIGLYDVGLCKSDISFSNPAPIPGEEIIVTATIHCHDSSDQVTEDVLVRFYDGDPSISINQINGDHIIPGMMPGSAVPVSVPYTVGDTLPRQIYVKVDPLNNIHEFNEDNNVAYKILPLEPCCDTCFVRAEPELLYLLYMFAVDSMDMSFYMGDMPWGYTVEDIDQSTIRINNTVEPFAMSILDSYPGFDGKVLRMDVRTALFLNAYYPNMWDSTLHSYIISGQYSARCLAIERGCEIWIRGHISGDANGDGKVTVLDIAYIIDFLYNGGEPLKPSTEVGDVNSSGEVNLLDISYLINYVLNNGPAPACPQTNY